MSFHSKVTEAEGWILSTSLKMIAIHVTEPDGPRGVIQLGKAHTELRRQTIEFLTGPLENLKAMTVDCQTEVNSDTRVDEEVGDLLSVSAIPHSVAERLVTQVTESSHVTAENEDLGDDPSSSVLSKQLFIEVMQLSNNFENLDGMSTQIKVSSCLSGSKTLVNTLIVVVARDDDPSLFCPPYIALIFAQNTTRNAR